MTNASSTKIVTLACLCILILIFLSFSGFDSKRQNIIKVKTYWEQVWGKGNLKAVADFYHPNAKHGENFTIEGFQKGVASIRTAFPDFKVTVNDIFATDNKVICEVTYSGTHTGGKMFKQEPLGKVVKVPGIDIFTFKDGKCINHQHVADHLDLVMQMGIQLIPTPVSK
jgi:predicted ester cyclase